MRKKKKMKILIIFNREPYDNTDVTWNGLRLAGKLLEAGQEVRIFVMNDAVDMARDVFKSIRCDGSVRADWSFVCQK